jgi:hypothetical protein
MKPGDIILKDINILRGLMERRFHPLLVNIILDVAGKFGIVMTESYRESRHKGDVHSTSPVRAIDLRTWCYPNHKAVKIKDWINYNWIYDESRDNYKVAIIHDSGNGFHFHIQVHPKTKKRAL